MTQIAISEELATSINSLASNRGCTPEEFLRFIVWQAETAEAFAEPFVTPDLQKRMLDDLKRVDKGEFMTSEEVDEKFVALFRELEAR